MKVKLIATQGARPTTISLHLPTIIGRSEDAKIRVRQSWVSRQHCTLYCEAERLYVRDLGSSNGTYINGTRIDELQEVRTGDLLRVGRVTFRIDVEPATPGAVPGVPAVPVVPVLPSVDNGSSSEPAPESPQPDEDSSALRYQENENGSFLGIDTGQPIADRIDDLPEIVGTNRVAPVDDIIGLKFEDSAGSRHVADDDSALGQFLKGFDK